MNRSEYLKATIFKNIPLIKKYNYELVLVNYDSKDDLHEFMVKNFSKEIEDKYIIYIKVANKQYFDRFHAKNIAHRYSTGEISIDLDCDNYITEDYISAINYYFNRNINIIIATLQKNAGRIAMTKENFDKLGGYIETMKNYGYEDHDLRIRFTTYINKNVYYLSEHLSPCIEQQDDFIEMYPYKGKYLDDKKVSLLDSNASNRLISDYYLEKLIMNPNEYNNIEYGKLSTDDKIF
jgi:predicted glycosyltransferase involved in capsule biosynthesis